MKELVEILLDNALKHADKKSTIVVSLKEQGNNIILSVTDTGDIIPNGEEEKIKVNENFNKFTKTFKAEDKNYDEFLLV